MSEDPSSKPPSEREQDRSIIASGLIRGIDPSTSSLQAPCRSNARSCSPARAETVEAGGERSRGHRQGDDLDKGARARADQYRMVRMFPDPEA